VSGLTSTESSTAPKTEPQRPICCKSCGQVVAKRADRGTCISGDEHTFRNPAGYSFHVVVFSQAQGCKQVGPAVSRDSWFPGYAWQIALCDECETHLGWFFRGQEGSFHGLIATRLSGL
jgi:hypothetical protein